MQRVMVSFDEMKPHHAEKAGIPAKLGELGMTNIRVGGDFDLKQAEIVGEVADFEAFQARFNQHPLANSGSLFKLAPPSKSRVNLFFCDACGADQPYRCTCKLEEG